MASEEGFEPSHTEMPTGLANPPLQPLGYPDICRVVELLVLPP